jgi:hypothetical protein
MRFRSEASLTFILPIPGIFIEFSYVRLRVKFYDVPGEGKQMIDKIRSILPSLRRVLIMTLVSPDSSIFVVLTSPQLLLLLLFSSTIQDLVLSHSP